MRLAKTISLALVALAAATASFTACTDKENTKITPRNEYDDPEGTPGETQEIDLTGYTILEKCACEFYGDYEGNGTSNFSLYLYDGEIDEDWYLTSEGQGLYIDIYCPEVTSLVIPEGTYTASSDCGEFTFDKGELDGGYVYGSSLEIQGADEDDYSLEPVTDGTVKFFLKDKVYTILADVTIDGKTCKYAYQGAIGILDMSDDEEEGDDDDESDIEVPEDVTVGDIVYAYASNLGEDWDITGTYCDWEMYLYTDMDDENSEWVMLEFIAKKGSDMTVIPDGTYKIEVGNDGYYKVGIGNAVPGTTQEGDEGTYTYGCIYIVGGYYWYYATAGSVTIKHNSGSNYTINYNFQDEQNNGSFKGSYTGDVDCYDYSEGESSAARMELSAAQKAGARLAVKAQASSKKHR